MNPSETKLLIEAVFKECQKHLNPDFREVMWKDNKPDNVKARDAIMYALKCKGLGLSEIGRVFAKPRPHCTVKMGLKRFGQMSYDETRPLYGLKIAIDAMLSGESIGIAIAYHERELERLKKLNGTIS